MQKYLHLKDSHLIPPLKFFQDNQYKLHELTYKWKTKAQGQILLTSAKGCIKWVKKQNKFNQEIYSTKQRGLIFYNY